MARASFGTICGWERFLAKRITNGEALAMRALARDAGASEQEIAARHGRPVSTISRIVTGRILPQAGGPISSPKRLRVPASVRQELLQSVNVHSRFLNDNGPHTKTLARRYGLDARSLRSRFLDAAIRWIDGFWEKVDRSSPTGCWPWTAGRLQCPGRPHVDWPGRYRGLDGRQHRAHILAWEFDRRWGGSTVNMILRHNGESDGLGWT